MQISLHDCCIIRALGRHQLLSYISYACLFGRFIKDELETMQAFLLTAEAIR